MGGDSSKILSAGLPNIEGELGWGNYRMFNKDYPNQGAFGVTIKTGLDWRAGEGYGNNGGAINIDASRSSKIYGNSDTVMPLSFVFIPQIKF